MDFVVGLLKTRRGNDSIWMIVDGLSKSAHFLSIKIFSTLDRLTKLYVNKIVSRHCVPVPIMSDRDPRLTSHFWTELQKALDTKLRFSITFHP